MRWKIKIHVQEKVLYKKRGAAKVRSNVEILVKIQHFGFGSLPIPD